ncbi:MAG: hypothetical protein AB7J46_04840 [Candidatus Altimarinota bacterium]
MADRDVRDSERRALAEGSLESEAAYMRKRIREGANDADLSNLLKGFNSNVDEILEQTDLSEGRQLLLKARFLIEQQIAFALENAIQPREGDAPLPSREAILASVMRTLTPAQAREILQFNEAKLVITPVTSVERYREELNAASQTMEGSREPYVSEFTQDHLNTQATQAQVEGNKIKKWRFAITEGAQTFDIPEWDNGQESLRDRINNRFNPRFHQSKMSRLDYQSYVGLMIQGLRQGKPIDCEYLNHSRKAGAQFEWQYTLLNETDEENGLVGAGLWHSDARSVGLYEFYLDLQHVDARLRPAVMGVVIGFLIFLFPHFSFPRKSRESIFQSAVNRNHPEDSGGLP